MTLSATVNKIAYPGPGGTVFTANFPAILTTDVEVYKTDQTTGLVVGSALVYGTDYTLSGLGGTGFTVTLTLDLGAYGLLIRRVEPLTMATNLPDEGNLRASSMQAALDKLARVDVQAQEQLNRSLHMPITDAGTANEIPVQTTDGTILGRVAGKFVWLSAATAQLSADLLSTVVGKGAALIAYLAPYTGAVGTTLANVLGWQTLNVRWFGAIGNGVADDTAAMQAAHNTGLLVHYPPGTYKFTSLSIVAGGIVGDGPTLTILNCTDATTTPGIKWTGAYTALAGGLTSGVPTFKDFTLNGNSLKTTGAGIQVFPATGETSYAFFSNVEVSYFPTQIDFVAASFFKVIGCQFRGHTVSGVQVANTNANDSGDSVIADSVFNTASTTAANILHFSSGGLRVIGNKMLGGGYGYEMQYTGTANTSNLLIHANSIENFTSGAISLSKVSAGLTSFKNVTIVGNEIGVSLGTPSAFLLTTDANAWLQNVVIEGNVFQLPGVTNSYGVAMVSVTALSIAGNTFRGNGGTSQAIGLTSCVDAKIGINVYSNITTPYVLTTPGANNSVALDSQSGVSTGSATGWAAYYGTTMYIGPDTTVTFPQAFQVTPNASDVEFSLASGDGSISAIVSSVSKTALHYSVVASRTSFTAVINWKVNGVL